MNLAQLLWKVKDLINLKDKNKKTIDDLRKESNNLNRELRELKESHKNQIRAIHHIHAEEISKKDAKISDYSRNLQEQRRTSNLVSDKFMLNNYRYYLVLFY